MKLFKYCVEDEKYYEVGVVLAECYEEAEQKLLERLPIIKEKDLDYDLLWMNDTVSLIAVIRK